MKLTMFCSRLESRMNNVIVYEFRTINSNTPHEAVFTVESWKPLPYEVGEPYEFELKVTA